MSSVTVSIRLVNGEKMEYREGPDFLQRLRSLQASGLKGKALIEELISDDWAAEPEVVTISDASEGGDILIQYT